MRVTLVRPAMLNYPQVRFASNEVRVYDTAADFTRDMTEPLHGPIRKLATSFMM